jgi:glycosyltransferase involved in cell wall biosynthesis
LTQKLRIIWHSNAPFTGSGYGVQTRYALDQFHSIMQREDSPIEDVALSAFYGLSAGKLNIEGMTVYGNPAPQADAFGVTFLERWIKDFGANLVITLIDAWVMKPDLGRQTHWMPWVPVDHDPVPPRVRNHIESAMQPIAMSRNGVEKLRETGINPSYIPHCTDTEAFRPPTPEERTRARQWMGFSDNEFVFTMVAANNGNPSRKSFPQIFEAFQHVSRTHPNARLYCHTVAIPPWFAIDLPELAKTFGIADKVIFPEPSALDTKFASDEEMAAVYWASDALLSPSMGEGFGVPIIEAQATGLPVITQDCTAMTELTKGGLVVPKGFRFWTYQNSYQYIPRWQDIRDSMVQLMEMSSYERRTMGDIGREFVAENYSLERNEERWFELLTKVARQVDVLDNEVITGPPETIHAALEEARAAGVLT